MNPRWLQVNLFYFFLIALLGVLMRSLFVGAPFSFNYEHILHTHSHIAFLGWLYQSLFIGLVNLYLDKDLIERGKYRWQFYITQVTVLGMLLAFSHQGYGPFSIALSSVFQLLTYWFAGRLWWDWRKNSGYHVRHGYSFRFIKIALLALVLSSLGPWGLAVISVQGLAGTPLYTMAIYFYLHFQYNGWFIFAVLGLFFYLLEKNDVPWSRPLGNRFFTALAAALVPGYWLSLLGLDQSVFTYFLATLGACLQVYAGILFFRLLKPIRHQLLTVWMTGGMWRLVRLAGYAFFLKILLQFLSLLPPLQPLAFENRNVIIAFIHLVVLGVVSIGLLAIYARVGWWEVSRWPANAGVSIFLLGFLGTELLLVFPVSGFAIPAYHLWVFGFSATMALGVGIFWLAQFISGGFKSA